MTDTTNGTAPDAQPADDIRSALASALAEHESDGAAVPVAGKSAPADGAGTDTDGAAAAGRKTPARGEGGKFVKAGDAADSVEKEDAATDGAEGTQAKPEADAGADKTDEEKAADAEKSAAEKTGEPPANWSAKDKEAFKAQTPEGREFLLRRHKEMEALVTRKTQEIASFRKEYEPVDKLLDPWKDQMHAAGYTKQALITAWANVEKRLMDPKERVGVVAGLIKGYQVDMGEVAKALGLQPRRQQAALGDGSETLPVVQQDGAQPALPPEIVNRLLNIQQRLDDQDRERAATQRRAANDAQARVMTEIESFKSAQDGKGQLLHPHFDDVESDMTLLAQAAIAAKQPMPPLSELYEKAVFANPSTREKALAAIKQAQRDADAKEARDKAERAKRASRSVTGAPGSGQAQTSTRKNEQTLREQLEAAAAEAAEA